eukprot:5104493-Pyramimonas_sp.AAC.1
MVKVRWTWGSGVLSASLALLAQEYPQHEVLLDVGKWAIASGHVRASDGAEGSGLSEWVGHLVGNCVCSPDGEALLEQGGMFPDGVKMDTITRWVLVWSAPIDFG